MFWQVGQAQPSQSASCTSRDTGRSRSVVWCRALVSYNVTFQAFSMLHHGEGRFYPHHMMTWWWHDDMMTWCTWCSDVFSLCTAWCVAWCYRGDLGTRKKGIFRYFVQTFNFVLHCFNSSNCYIAHCKSMDRFRLSIFDNMAKNFFKETKDEFYDLFLTWWIVNKYWHYSVNKEGVSKVISWIQLSTH